MIESGSGGEDELLLPGREQPNRHCKGQPSVVTGWGDGKEKKKKTMDKRRQTLGESKSKCNVSAMVTRVR